MNKPVERVLVVETDWISSLHNTKGLIQNVHADFLRTLPSKAFFIDRPHAEMDSKFRQVIPYVLIHMGDKYLVVTRHRSQGEPRLHDKMSLGIGGHINPIDGTPDEIINSGLKRELSEELATDNPPDFSELQLLGLIYDDGDDVSRVHLGLVLRWDIDSRVDIRETEKMHGEYLSVDEISSLRERLENWSRLVYDGILNKKKHN